MVSISITVHPAGGDSMTGTGQQNHFVSCSQDSLGQGVAHATAAGVGKIADIIEVFACRPGGNQHAHQVVSLAAGVG